jgi:hypothetical protein
MPLSASSTLPVYFILFFISNKNRCRYAAIRLNAAGLIIFLFNSNTELMPLSASSTLLFLFN